jgi:hydrogenase nickel incorporation protein HypA/HybF
MHELSIALSLLDLVDEEAARRNSVVSAVHVKLGALSGVVKEALSAAYDLAREGTDLANCELVIEAMPTIVRCKLCGADSRPESIYNICCLHCGTANVEITGGRELEVSALEIEPCMATLG